MAETFDLDGNILGRWLVQWDEIGRGRCHQAGTVVRYVYSLVVCVRIEKCHDIPDISMYTRNYSSNRDED